MVVVVLPLDENEQLVAKESLALTSGGERKARMSSNNVLQTMHGRLLQETRWKRGCWQQEARNKAICNQLAKKEEEETKKKVENNNYNF